jgi:predicted porin
VEDLGGGLHAVFQLENGFYTNTGAMTSAGTLWNRQAYVGLGSDQIGTVTLGHQTPFMFDVLGPLSTGYLAASWYAFHPGNIDELADTSIVPYNNSVKFRSTSLAGFSFGAMMGLGNTTNFSTGRTLSFAASYANGPFRAGAVYSNEHDRTFSLTTTGITKFQGVAAANGRVVSVRQTAGAWSVHAREAGVARLLGYVSDLRRRCELRLHAGEHGRRRRGDDKLCGPSLDAVRNRRYLCVVEVDSGVRERAV